MSAPLLLLAAVLTVATLQPTVSAAEGTGASADETFEERAANALISAKQAGDPLLSVVALDPEIDLLGSYRIQKRFVLSQLGGLPPSGFKAGFTNRASQQQLGLSTPVAGVLPASGRLEGHVTLARADFRRLWFETEIAFEIGTAIGSPLADTAALADAVRAVRPAIELPDVTLASIDPLEPRDLVAANVLAAHFLVGPPFPIGALIPPIPIRVLRDGSEVHAHRLDDPGELYEGVVWLVNHLLDEGYTLEPGMILLSGSLGPPRDAAEGAYLADFGPLGSVRFDVR